MKKSEKIASSLPRQEAQQNPHNENKVLSTIPVIIQDAGFRVLEQFQFKARWLNYGCSIISHSNDEVMLIKRFFDGFKITLYRVK